MFIFNRTDSNKRGSNRPIAELSNTKTIYYCRSGAVPGHPEEPASGITSAQQAEAPIALASRLLLTQWKIKDHQLKANNITCIKKVAGVTGRRR